MELSTIYEQSTAGHGVAACAEEGGRRGQTNESLTELGQFFTVFFKQNTSATSDTRQGKVRAIDKINRGVAVYHFQDDASRMENT